MVVKDGMLAIRCVKCKKLTILKQPFGAGGDLYGGMWVCECGNEQTVHSRDIEEVGIEA